ncbi:hypothetical protein GCM10007967_29690 [Xylanimonas ulmi]
MGGDDRDIDPARRRRDTEGRHVRAPRRRARQGANDGAGCGQLSVSGVHALMLAYRARPCYLLARPGADAG